MKRYSKLALMVGILLVVYSLINYSLNQIWDWTSTLSLVVGLIIGGVGVYYILKFRKRELSAQTIKYGTNLIISTLVFVGILVLQADGARV